MKYFVVGLKRVLHRRCKHNLRFPYILEKFISKHGDKFTHTAIFIRNEDTSDRVYPPILFVIMPPMEWHYGFKVMQKLAKCEILLYYKRLVSLLILIKNVF